MQLAWGAGVGMTVAAVVAALLTPPQQPAAAEPAAQLPIGLQYVPTDAAAFGYVEFTQLWKSPLGDTFRKLKLPALDKELKDLTDLTGLKLEDLATATVYTPELKQPQDSSRLVVIITTTKAYDRKTLVALLENTPGAKTGKYENKDNVIRVTPNGGGEAIFADLSDDKRLVFGLGLKDDPKADPNRAAGPHTSLFKQAAGATLVGGLNFANLPDEIRRDDDNFPPQMRAFLPIAKSETMSLVGRLTAKELRLSVAVRSANKRMAGEVEKSLDILRGLAKVGLDGAEKELKQAEDDGDDVKALRPLLKVAGDVLKSGKLTVDDRTTTATLTVPVDLPYGSFVEFVASGSMTSNVHDQNNLKQLGLFIHNYESSFGTLCPSYLVDKKGKPTLSWRVMALPFVEQEGLYKKFKLDEPWDSAHNMKVFKDNPMPAVFLNSGDKAEDKTTRYRVFTGNAAGWDPTGRLKLIDITDGTSNTVAIVTAATAVPWTKPDELEFDPEKEVGKLLHFKGGRCNIGLFDGSLRSITKKVSEKTLKAAVTRAGGEVLGEDW
jgi:hypothetical protein